MIEAGVALAPPAIDRARHGSRLPIGPRRRRRGRAVVEGGVGGQRRHHLGSSPRATRREGEELARRLAEGKHGQRGAGLLAEPSLSPSRRRWPGAVRTPPRRSRRGPAPPAAAPPGPDARRLQRQVVGPAQQGRGRSGPGPARGSRRGGMTALSSWAMPMISASPSVRSITAASTIMSCKATLAAAIPRAVTVPPAQLVQPSRTGSGQPVVSRDDQNAGVHRQTRLLQPNQSIPSEPRGEGGATSPSPERPRAGSSARRPAAPTTKAACPPPRRSAARRCGPSGASASSRIGGPGAAASAASGAGAGGGVAVAAGADQQGPTWLKRAASAGTSVGARSALGQDLAQRNAAGQRREEKKRGDGSAPAPAWQALARREARQRREVCSSGKRLSGHSSQASMCP